MWNPFKRTPKQDTTLKVIELVQEMMTHSQEMNLRTVAAVESMTVTSQKHADILSKYLGLFQSPGEPRRWVDEPEAENEKALLDRGFPKDASEQEQAEWVLANL